MTGTPELAAAAAERAVELVESGMVVGLGTGRAATYALRRLTARLGDGTLRDIRGVPTSSATEAEARRLGVPLLPLDAGAPIDLTIDGADEVDPALRLIKGGGGALLREKIVAEASRRVAIVVDETKLSDVLGTRWPLPVEVVPFRWEAQARFLESLGGPATLRLGAGGTPYETDQRNFVLDCAFGPLHEPALLAEQLSHRAGIVAHGLFIGLATDLLVGTRTGVTHRTRTI